jgi:hypothetical protein
LLKADAFFAQCSNLNQALKLTLAVYLHSIHVNTANVKDLIFSIIPFLLASQQQQLPSHKTSAITYYKFCLQVLSRGHQMHNIKICTREKTTLVC